MRYITNIILISVLGCSSPKIHTLTKDVYPHGTDSLLIDYRFIDNHSDSTTSIYLLDASLGKRADELEAELKTRRTATNYRIIGIGQSKYSGKKRRRDFAPPNDTSFFEANAGFQGRADLFLAFISDSILPAYDVHSDKRILVGHSFGGLFSVYVSTLEQHPFNEIYALSPSLWVNYRSFAKHYKTNDSLYIKTPLHISYGSLEQLNLVGPSIVNFNEILKPRDVPLVTVRAVSGKTHISMIKEINNIVP